MSFGQRIIDEDIDTYTACMEAELDKLRRCPVDREPYYKQRYETAKAVIEALKAHRDAIDAGPTIKASVD